MTIESLSQPHVPTERIGRHKTILAAAAAWHLRSLVRAAVENKRTKVVEASSLEELRAITGEHIDLVILDAGLAHDDPMLSYDYLKRDPALIDVPFILLTDRAEPAATLPSGRYHPDRTLHKHFSPFELLNIVYALIGY